MKISPYIVMFILLIFSSCITQKENYYLVRGSDYGTKPPTWNIGYMYYGLNFNVIDSVIYQFGNNYTYKRTDLEEIYEWKGVMHKSLSNRSLDVRLTRLVRTDKSVKSNHINVEEISLSIFENGRDFLEPLKFRNRMKTKRFLNNIE